MPRGGYRPGSGPAKGTKYKPRAKKAAKAPTKKSAAKKKTTANIEAADQYIKEGQKTPLEYMLSVINDKKASDDRRDRMAQVAAAYVHPRLAEQRGKKDDRKDRAKAAGKGKFAAAAPPKLKAVNGGK